MLAGAPDQHLLEEGAGEHQLLRRTPAVEAQVGDDLVVSAASRVQPARGGADALVEAAFHGRVDVLVAGIGSELAALELAADVAQPAIDGAMVTAVTRPEARGVRAWASDASMSSA